MYRLAAKRAEKTSRNKCDR